MRLGLIFSTRDIYRSISNWTHSQNLIAAAEASSLKISYHGLSLKWSQRPSLSAQENSWVMWWNGVSHCEFHGKSMETETTTWSEFPNGEFTRLISSTRIGKPVLMINVKVSKHKNSRWVDRESLINVRWNSIENHAQRPRWSIEEKEIRHRVKLSQSKT